MHVMVKTQSRLKNYTIVIGTIKFLFIIAVSPVNKMKCTYTVFVSLASK